MASHLKKATLLSLMMFVAGITTAIGTSSESALTEGVEPMVEWHVDDAPHLGQVVTEPDYVIRYAVDPLGLKDTFRQEGTVTLQVMDGKSLVVAGHELDLFADRGIYEMSMEHGLVKVGETSSIPIHGAVVGETDSLASLTLGEWGIYGFVRTPTVEFNLVPEMHEQGPIQNVEAYLSPLSSSTPTSALLERAREISRDLTTQHHTLSGSTISRVWMQTDNVLNNANPNWGDLATSAMTAQHSVWLTTAGIMLDLRIAGTSTITDQNIAVSADCTGTGNNYVNYLTNYFNTYYGPWWHQSHQFWSGYALDARGCAYPTEVININSYADARAASVVTGVSMTGYNVNNQHHRGQVSAHELGHVYGSPHYYNTNALGQYEIMASGVNLDNRAFWWSSSASGQIHCRYYHATNPPCA